MPLTHLDQPQGLSALNEFLESRSYIEGFKASQADVAVFEEVKTAPDAGSYPHAARWFAHIAAHKAGFAKLPGTKKAASEYAPGVTVGESKAAASSSAAPKADEEDDIDLFGSDDDLDEEAERIKAERVAAYQAKKSDKPAVIAKSQVVLDVKPWDDETDMDALTKHVKSIEMEGLLWGAHKLVAVGYGIKKLQITCIVEDALVSIDELSDKIAEDEDHVQSVDIAAFNKL